MTTPDSIRSIETALAEVRAGNRDAFHVVVRETLDGLGAYVSFLVTDLSSVDDIIQEVYIRAYQQLDDYTPGTHFFAWIKTIAKYVILTERGRVSDRRKAHSRYIDRVGPTLSEWSEEWEESGKASIEEDLEVLRSCIQKLKGTMQAVIRLHYYDGLKIADIANRLYKNASVIGVTLHRARKTLALCMEKHGGIQ